MCGEKKSAINCGSFTLGSPPRVRGKGNDRAVECAADGITPACAGKSPYEPAGIQGLQDHPRVCGEKLTG